VIYLYCTRQNPRPFSTFLRVRWPRPEFARVRIVFYDEADELRVRPGLHVLADIELLEGPLLEAAQAHFEALKAQPATCVVWNEPKRSARRFDVLSRLEAEGKNLFRARRVVGETVPEGLRYPIFIRDEHEHLGPLTPILHTPEQAQVALAVLRAHVRAAERPLLAVEYLDYADAEGIHRKYSVFRLGRKLFPRHQFFSRDWVVKVSSADAHDSWVAEEARFIATNPHRAEIEPLFNTFAIDYGRIDYTVVEGRVQVFEINTNPMILQAHLLEDARRRAMHLAFAEAYISTLTAADPGPGPNLRAKLRWRLRSKIRCLPRKWRRGGKF
jgi:hypothetical protein